MIAHYLIFGIGGGLGAVLRVFISRIIDTKFPWSTLLINFLGCLCFGIIMRIFSHHKATYFDERWLAHGFCGGFTTFSYFSYQTLVLFKTGKTSLGILNMFLSITACLIGMWLGLSIIK